MIRIIQMQRNKITANLLNQFLVITLASLKYAKLVQGNDQSNCLEPTIRVNNGGKSCGLGPSLNDWVWSSLSMKLIDWAIGRERKIDDLAWKTLVDFSRFQSITALRTTYFYLPNKRLCILIFVTLSKKVYIPETCLQILKVIAPDIDTCCVFINGQFFKLEIKHFIDRPHWTKPQFFADKPFCWDDGWTADSLPGFAGNELVFQCSRDNIYSECRHVLGSHDSTQLMPHFNGT